MAGSELNSMSTTAVALFFDSVIVTTSLAENWTLPVDFVMDPLAVVLLLSRAPAFTASQPADAAKAGPPKTAEATIVKTNRQTRRTRTEAHPQRKSRNGPDTIAAPPIQALK